ncbi:MAG TPA: DoxX family protein [Gemmataceae bacterium]|nr:DoxX family protein [Gemmataceae bacterium]
MRRLFYPDPPNCLTSAGLLLLRLAVGAAFVFHGLPKVQNPLGWMGSEAPVPGILQAAAAVAEFGGGIALVLGVVTRLAALGIIGVMVGALATYHLPQGHPFVGKPGESSSELAVVYLAASVLFLLAGPGRFSVDRCVFGRPAVPERA